MVLSGMAKVVTPTVTPLPKDLLSQVADVACVPAEKREGFCELVQGSVDLVWTWSRRAFFSTEPGQALVDAAEAARNFHQALLRVNTDDRAWLDRLVQHAIPSKEDRNDIEEATGRNYELPWYEGGLDGLQRTVYQLARLFSIAVNKSPPKAPGKALDRTAKDVISQQFVCHLLIDVDQAGGMLSVEKNLAKGTLIDALNLLAKYLPPGVDPNRLSVTTLQRLKSRYRSFYTEAMEAGFDSEDVLPPKD